MEQTNEQQMEPTKYITEENDILSEVNNKSTTSQFQQSPKTTDAKTFTSEEIPSKKIRIINPFKNLNSRVTELVYWENPVYSGAVLSIGLSFLIYTAYYSLFNTFCALAFILIGLNWVYVTALKQFQSLINQKPINPFKSSLANNPWYIEREKAVKYFDIAVEIINFLSLEAQKIVLVDDPMRTIKYALFFYMSWTLGCWVNFRTFLGIGLVLGFSVPTAYQKNKVLVDEKLDQSSKFLHSHLDRGLHIARQHTGGIYEKAKSFAVNKGIVNGATQDAKKEE